MFNVKDSRVRFVPFGFKLGDQSTRQFAKNPYVIAHVGEENADVIAEIADKFKHKPKVWGKGMNLVDLDVKRYTGLSSEWGFCIGRYTFSGRYKGDSDGGCAFGVKKD